MIEFAIIGGSGFTRLDSLKIIRREVVHTPYGEPSAPLTHGLFHGRPVVFLPRHGAAHTIPPHKVNYRANLWALQHVGVERVIAIAAVGGIDDEMAPGVIAIPDQIIDYTYARDHTFFEDGLSTVTHIDFTQPYCAELRRLLLQAAEASGIEVVYGGTYGATQGPRLETSMEINRMQQDGCHLVGMTGMPEAALARELDICYASCAVVANWAAGRGAGPITMEEIERHLSGGMEKVHNLLSSFVTSI